MAGTAKDIQVGEILQGPGDLWEVATAPLDGAPRVDLASDGTPDAATHGASVHMGAILDAITMGVKPKVEPIMVDTYESPVGFYATDLEAKLEATLAQITLSLLAKSLGAFAAYSSGAGFKQVIFGGLSTVTPVCVAAVSPKRTDAAKHVISCLYSAVPVGGISFGLGRSKQASMKVTYQGLAAPARTVGRQVGMFHETMADAAGGTPTAKAVVVTDIHQGPCDLWILGTGPTNAAVYPTLHTDLTPDATAHPASIHLGAPSGETVITVTPKIEFIRIDSCDAPVGACLVGLECSIEAEMTQTEMKKIRRALGVGAYEDDSNPGPETYRQVGFGGTSVPESLCVAAIAAKRSAATKAIGACLYAVSAVEGVTITHSRSKAGMYKVKFSGQMDLDSGRARTAGKQTGVIWETV